MYNMCAERQGTEGRELLLWHVLDRDSSVLCGKALTTVVTATLDGPLMRDAYCCECMTNVAAAISTSLPGAHPGARHRPGGADERA